MNESVFPLAHYNINAKGKVCLPNTIVLKYTYNVQLRMEINKQKIVHDTNDENTLLTA